MPSLSTRTDLSRLCLSVLLILVMLGRLDAQTPLGEYATSVQKPEQPPSDDGDEQSPPTDDDQLDRLLELSPEALSQE